VYIYIHTIVFVQQNFTVVNDKNCATEKQTIKSDDIIMMMMMMMTEEEEEEEEKKQSSWAYTRFLEIHKLLFFPLINFDK